jgi:hypothetical protein
MPAAAKNRLEFIAYGCLMAGALLVGIAVESGLRFFGAGLLIGAAIVLVTLRQARWFN